MIGNEGLVWIFIWFVSGSLLLYIFAIAVTAYSFIDSIFKKPDSINGDEKEDN